MDMQMCNLIFEVRKKFNIRSKRFYRVILITRPKFELFGEIGRLYPYRIQTLKTFPILS